MPIQLGDLDFSFTNSALFMTLAVTLASAFLMIGIRRGSLVPGRWQSITEISYEFIAGMIRDNVGQEGRRYFPFIFTLFMFVLFGNLLGLLPYGFTYTSHIIVTFAMAAFVFVGVTAIGFIKHGLPFLKFLMPTGVPIYMAKVTMIWLETKPWLFILFFVLGSAAGMLNVYRTAAGYDHGIGYTKQKNSPPGPEAKD